MLFYRILRYDLLKMIDKNYISLHVLVYDTKNEH